ncbi:hypothetical protein GCM10007904_03370 [Oharaeibacter diazotrophicus]|nr:hypothetical protein GCM10007904_03370 [Oharaeibacter diazotrophicus]
MAALPIAAAEKQSATAPRSLNAEATAVDERVKRAAPRLIGRHEGGPVARRGKARGIPSSCAVVVRPSGPARRKAYDPPARAGSPGVTER